ncbi:MAG: hypothetical protein COB66_07575 [Coxiella sp. (in: Bacteria)]|nr:MAG: hypothetical protein COB66_07575 [Coxiella sp. (in: g-proteobacteria)]
MIDENKQQLLASKSILVVDDNPDICELCREYLKPLVGSVTTNNGTDVIETLEAVRDSDVLVLDVMLEQTDCVSYCRAIDALFPDVRIIIITGYECDDILKMLSGVLGKEVCVVKKPFTADDLVEAITTTISASP